MGAEAVGSLALTGGWRSSGNAEGLEGWGGEGGKERLVSGGTVTAVSHAVSVTRQRGPPRAALDPEEFPVTACTEVSLLL